MMSFWIYLFNENSMIFILKIEQKRGILAILYDIIFYIKNKGGYLFPFT